MLIYTCGDKDRCCRLESGLATVMCGGGDSVSGLNAGCKVPVEWDG